MNIRRAVITAASQDQSALPLQSLVDQHGNEKTALALILEETMSAGVEEVCLIICPGQCGNYEKAAGDYASRVSFIEQDHPRGYGDALFRAAEFVGDDSFLHLVGDHLYISDIEKGCARQLVELAQRESCTVSAVQATRENMLPYFGTVAARRVAGRNDLYEISKVVEKPTPTFAEQELVVAGLRSSYYLCLFGMHVLTPAIMHILKEHLAQTPPDRSVQLSPALSALAHRERYLALQVQGARYNIGMKYGLLFSQLALALSGMDRDQVLTQLLELVATRSSESVGATG